ncbi:MAG: hypothetical protein ACM3QZ_07905 [Solirubrobacterales bacterium]
MRRARLLLNCSALIIVLWGISHLIPTGRVVAGFGAITPDNQKIILMEWISEGMTLIFLGGLTAIVTLAGGMWGRLGRLVLLSVAGMLLMMAALTLATGAQTALVPIKLCPAVKSLSAVLIVSGVYLSRKRKSSVKAA